MTDILTRHDWHTVATGPDAELAELRRRLAAAEKERDEHAALITRARDALAADYAEAAQTAKDTGDDPDQYRAMLFSGQRNGALRAYAQFLAATLTYPSVEAAAIAIADGKAWGQTDYTTVYGPDGFTPLCERSPF
jgi:hypothetical protein